MFNGVVIAGPSLSITPDFARLAQFGVTPASLQYQLQTALEGNVVSSILEPEQQPAVRIVYPGNRRLSIADIPNLRLSIPGGRLQPITQLATVKINAGDAEIQRENLQSMGVVTARLEGRGLGTVMAEIKAAIGKKVSLPPGYHIEYGGSYAQQQKHSASCC